MSDNEKSGSKGPVVKLSQLMGQLKQEGAQFFLNSLLEPIVHLPDDPYQKDWPADSQRVEDRVNTVYYDLSGDGYLKTAERDFLLSLVREECRKGGRRFTEVEGPKTDQDAIVQAVLCLMNGVTEFDDLTAVLLNKLRTLQQQGRVGQSEEIPVFTNIFSRRLGRLVSVLRGYGIEVDFRHEEDGSHCRLARLPNFLAEPEAARAHPKAPDDLAPETSAEPSGEPAKTGKDLRVTDGADGEVRFDAPDAKALMTPPKPSTEAAEGETTGANGPDNTIVVAKGGAQ